MWTSQLQQIDRQTSKITLSHGKKALSFHEVIDLWCDSHEFRFCFTEQLSQSCFEAFFWETLPVTNQTSNCPFEFVLIEGLALLRRQPDPSPFQSQFSSHASQEVLAFPNLGGDAILVVPKPLTDASCYTHLASFLRKAPESQVDALWRSVGLAMRKRISSAPTWLSTAGLGVSWLHLRLDSRPKYYRHDPYKAFA